MRGPSTHTIDAEIERKVWLTPISDEWDTVYPVIRIKYEYSPGCPAFTPPGEYGPIDPPEPAEVSFISAELINGDGLSPSIKEVQEWADDWLQSEGLDRAMDNAEQDRRERPYADRI